MTLSSYGAPLEISIICCRKAALSRSFREIVQKSLLFSLKIDMVIFELNNRMEMWLISGIICEQKLSESALHWSSVTCWTSADGIFLQPYG